MLNSEIFSLKKNQCIFLFLVSVLVFILCSCSSLDVQSIGPIAPQEVIKIATAKALAEGWLEGEFFIKKISLFENGWIVWIESKIPMPGGHARMMISPDGKVIEYWGGA